MSGPLAQTLSVDRGWELAATAPGAHPGPDGLDGLSWRPATVPGTVASALGLPLDHTEDIEASDWWFRCRLAHPEDLPPGTRLALRFEGLATLAEVWLDGQPLLRAENMHRRWRCPLPEGLPAPGGSELVVVFRSLSAALAGRRPRPRWKTALVAEQKLRWIRTSLLGRIPGWTPPLPAVGPWRPIYLELLDGPEVHDLTVHAGLSEGEPRLRLGARVAPEADLRAAWVTVGGQRRELSLAEGTAGVDLRLDARLPELAPWWPHTLGTPARHRATLHLQTAAGEHTRELGALGFREVAAVDGAEGAFALRINGVDLPCWGACWTPPDIRSLHEDPQRTARLVAHLAAGGLRMLRVIGPHAWASEALLAACDAAGVLLWQDLPLANMDHPHEDPTFAEELAAEVRDNLRRFQGHPCLAVLCGGSEVAQQAAMVGLPEAAWSSAFVETALPALRDTHLPGVAVVPGTPWGGALPFHTATGLSHYYGLGAYRRPVGDVRRAAVRFSPECLGFSHLPEESVLHDLFEGARPVPHAPRWKAGVPRDTGAGWDFEDIRDHYLGQRFGCDPVALRSVDLDRYLACSRALTGELLLEAFAEWRRAASPCQGALVWFLRDLRPGAGWGVLDHRGLPKAAWYALMRAWSPRAALLTDEGLDGVDLHVHNETSEALRGRVRLRLVRSGRGVVDEAEAPVAVPPQAQLRLQGDALLGRFTDLAGAYRFGPPRHDVILACLEDEDGTLLHQDARFPQGLDLPRRLSLDVQASVEVRPDGELWLHLEAERFVQCLSLGCRDHVPEDDFFHLAPGQRRTIRVRPGVAEPRPFRAVLSALNAEATLTVRAPR